MSVLLARRGAIAASRPVAEVADFPQLVGATATGAIPVSGSVTVTPPVGAVEWYAVTSGETATITPPSGWTLAGGDVMWGVYVSTSSPGSSWACTGSLAVAVIGLDRATSPDLVFVPGLISPPISVARPTLAVRVLSTEEVSPATVTYPSGSTLGRATVSAGTGETEYRIGVAADAHPDGGVIYGATWGVSNDTDPTRPSLTLTFTSVLPAWVPTDPTPGLAWSEEFNTGALSDLWLPVYWPAGYTNSEEQAYTPRTDNLTLSGTDLKIRALREAYDQDGYSAAFTSGRIISKAAFRLGKFEARIKVPAGKGLWPAFWLAGLSVAGWPADGEIDIMEMVNAMTTQNSTVHGVTTVPDNWQLSKSYTPGGSFADDYHVYQLTWTETQMLFGVDDHVFWTLNKSDVTAPKVWPFDNPQQIILNLAVGGTWPGATDGTTPSVSEMLVDWVHVSDAEVYPNRL
nr:glycoside hydrolase family 16 protein [Microbacterium bovistercoris]